MTPIWTTIFEILFLKKPGLVRVVTLLLALGGLWIVFSKQTILPLPENSETGYISWRCNIGGMMSKVVKYMVISLIFSFFL